jgi:hypothetical protein
MKNNVKPVLLVAMISLVAMASGSLTETRAGDAEVGKALSTTTRAILERGEKFVLISIDPNRFGLNRENDKRERFHDYPILGKTEIGDAIQRRNLLDALYAGVPKDEPGVDRAVTGCFIPRHAIRAVAGTNWVELLICFECGEVREFTASGRSECLMGHSPREIFNQTLKEAGVPLAKQ